MELPLNDWMRVHPDEMWNRPGDDIASLQKLRSLMDDCKDTETLIHETANYVYSNPTPINFWSALASLRSKSTFLKLPSAEDIPRLLSECFKHSSSIKVITNTSYDTLSIPASIEQTLGDLSSLSRIVPTPAELPISIASSRQLFIDSLKTECTTFKLSDRLIPDAHLRIESYSSLTLENKNKMVFFSNIPVGATPDDLRKCLATIGEVQEVEMVQDPRPWMENRRISGTTAFVTFRDEETCRKVTGVAGRIFGMLCTSEYESRSIYAEVIDRKRTLLVKGVPWGCSVEEVLYELAKAIAGLNGVERCEIELMNAGLFKLNGRIISSSFRDVSRYNPLDKGNAEMKNDGIFCLRFETADEALFVLRGLRESSLVISRTVCQVMPTNRKCMFVSGKYIDYVLPVKSSVYDSIHSTPLTL
jgi:hypothetical protein